MKMANFSKRNTNMKIEEENTMNINASVFITEYDLEGQPYDEYSITLNQSDKIYDKFMELTDNDTELSSKLLIWCKEAKVGEEYKTDYYKLEIAQMMLL